MNLTYIYIATLLEVSVDEIQSVCDILGFTVTDNEITSGNSGITGDLEDFFLTLAGTAEDKEISLEQAALAIASQYRASDRMELDRSDEVFFKLFGSDPALLTPGSLPYQTYQMWKQGVLPEAEVTSTLLRAGRAEMIGHHYFNGTGKSEEGSTLSQATDLENQLIESFFQNSSGLAIGQAPSLVVSNSQQALTGA